MPKSIVYIAGAKKVGQGCLIQQALHLPIQIYMPKQHIPTQSDVSIHQQTNSQADIIQRALP